MGLLGGLIIGLREMEIFGIFRIPNTNQSNVVITEPVLYANHPPTVSSMAPLHFSPV